MSLKKNPRSEGQFTLDSPVQQKSYPLILERTSTLDQEYLKGATLKQESETNIDPDPNQIVYVHKLRKIMTKEELVYIFEECNKQESINLEENQKDLSIMKERLEKGFSFDAMQNSKIKYSNYDPLNIYTDIFNFLQKCHSESQRVSNKMFKNTIKTQLHHRKVYDSQQRREWLKFCDVEFSLDSSLQVTSRCQANKLYQSLIDTQQYTRLLSLITCLFQFKYEKIQEIAQNIEQQLYFLFEQATKIFIYNSNDLRLLKMMCKGIKHDNPYVQLFYNFFGMDDQAFQDFLANPETKIHFYDRLMLCCLYCDEFKLNELFERPVSLDQIIVFGKNSEKSIECMRQYLQKTGDIQLVGIIAAHLFILGHPDKEILGKWFFQYQQLLNSQNLYQERVDAENQMKDLQNPNQLLEFLDNRYARTSQITHQCWCMQNANPECSSCFTLYPKCSICFSPIQFQQYIVCLKCKHGGHEKHIQEWFATYNQCPYKKCRCQCSYI